MGWMRKCFALMFVLGLFISASLVAAEEESDESIIIYDFEDGIPQNSQLQSSLGSPRESPTAELEKNDGKTVLELGKNALMIMGDKEYVNFSIEATIRREYDMSTSHVGFQFRNGYRAYIRRPGRVELAEPKNKRVGRGFTRNLSTHIPIKFKIVVVGPVVRFFVDGRYEGQYNGLEMTPGPIALYQRDARAKIQHNVYFDDVRLNTRVEPAQFLVCEPVVGEDKVLVFNPSKDVKLQFKVTNYYEDSQTAELGIDLATFDDEPVYRTSPAPALIKSGESKTLSVNLGRIPEGFYRLTFFPTGKVSPLAVHMKGTVTEDQIRMPEILTGVYWYYFPWEGLPEVWWKTYMHAAGNDLRRHNFNTVIGAGGMPTEAIKILGQYGIRCFTRRAGASGNVADPNVIGGFIGDEPQQGDEERYLKQYQELIEKYPDKIWTTCMVGDGGVEGCQNWWNTWMPLSKNDKVVRMVRWYGIKKFSSGIKRTYGSVMPLTETLRGLNKGKGPYYIILPSFGGNNGLNAYFSNPLPSQIRCMMHLAAAHQARGIFFFSYQKPTPQFDAFVDPATLMPQDEKWAAAGEAAAMIQKNADLLAEFTWVGRYSFVEGPGLLEAFRLSKEGDPAQYFYVINMDTEESINGRLYQLDTNATLYDLFTDQEIPITKGTVQLMRPDQRVVSGVAQVSLMPGDGVLLKYVKEEKAAGAMPRVIYPEAVANVSEDRIIWLADLEPIEMPTTGWIPQIKFKDKTWYPDFHSNDIKLFSGPDDAGQLYKKSLWAHAETTIKYKIPDAAKTFAAAAGFGSKSENSSAVFRVLVDGKEKYNSGMMRLDTGVQPVVVDISGGKVLELITEEAGDGLYNDYTFWGEARLIRE